MDAEKIKVVMERVLDLKKEFERKENKLIKQIDDTVIGVYPGVIQMRSLEDMEIFTGEKAIIEEFNDKHFPYQATVKKDGILFSTLVTKNEMRPIK